MAIATGVERQLAYKDEAGSWGTLPANTSWQLLRRVQSSLNMTKNTYESNEMRSDYQVSDFRHGTRKTGGTITGELSGGTYQYFIEAACRKAAAAITAATAVSLTVGAAVSGSHSLTRAAGSWVTDGFRVGQVIRLSVGTLNAANINKNLMITGYTSATVITVTPMNGVAMVAEGPIAGCTVTAPGKVIIVPTTGHIDRSCSIEQWDPGVTNSERYVGNKISSCGFRLPATGMTTIEIGLMGKDMSRAASQYASSPLAATTSGVMAAVNGVLRINNLANALVTGLNIDINGGHSTGEVVGSSTTPDVFEGRVRISGQATVYYDGGSLVDNFINEDEIDLFVALTATNAANAEFVSIYLPRIKLGGNTKDDGEKGLIQTIPFTALLKPTTTGWDSTTMTLQDSLFV